MQVKLTPSHSSQLQKQTKESTPTCGGIMDTILDVLSIGKDGTKAPLNKHSAAAPLANKEYKNIKDLNPNEYIVLSKDRFDQIANLLPVGKPSVEQPKQSISLSIIDLKNYDGTLNSWKNLLSNYEKSNVIMPGMIGYQSEETDVLCVTMIKNFKNNNRFGVNLLQQDDVNKLYQSFKKQGFNPQLSLQSSEVLEGEKKVVRFWINKLVNL